MTVQAEIVGYLYRGEYYCPACIVHEVSPGASQDWRDAPEAYLDFWSVVIGFDRSREHTFRSDDFPHTITDDTLEPPRIMCDTCVCEIA